MTAAIVTGAAGGMGLAIARALTALKLHVVGVDLVAPPKGAVAGMVVGDVREQGVAEQAFDLAHGLGKAGELHLVHCAGVTVPGMPTTDAAWDQTLDVNLTAPFAWSRLYAQRLDEGRIKSGGMVFIGSLATAQGFPNNPAYQASKAGVTGLMRAFAYDLGPKGIRVNCVSPGYIATAMTAGSFADPAMNAARKAHTLLGRWGTPQDVAGVVAFLCSSAASYVTGVNLFVDGGWTCRGLIDPA